VTSAEVGALIVANHARAEAAREHFAAHARAEAEAAAAERRQAKVIAALRAQGFTSTRERPYSTEEILISVDDAAKLLGGRNNG
jgi:hypothetical protein